MLSSRPVPINADGYGGVAHIRTPGRALLKNRGALQENAIHPGSMTVKGKGKSTMMHTPFRPSTQVKKGVQTTGKPTITVTRPLGDKTPFPNRQMQPLQTPAPQTAKLAKLALLEGAFSETPGALLLPSARRKSLRLPRSASKQFCTPITQGNHWDVSDGDIEVEINTGAAQEQLLDYDEVEYMPPSVSEQPYEPSFEMPDYKELGQTIMRVIQVGICDDTLDAYYSADIDTQIDTQQLFKDCNVFARPELTLSNLDDDDPFESSFTSTIQKSQTRTSTPTAPVARSTVGPSKSHLSQPTTGPSIGTRSSARIAQTTKSSTLAARAAVTSSTTGPSRLGATTRASSFTTSAAPVPRPATSIGVRASVTRKIPSPSEPPRASSATGTTPTLTRTSSAQGTARMGAKEHTASLSRVTANTVAAVKGPMTRARSAAGMLVTQTTSTSAAAKVPPTRMTSEGISLFFDDPASDETDFLFDV